MSYRVIQWATGNLGRLAIEGILAHPPLELAAAWVHSASNDGKDPGARCGPRPTGASATPATSESRISWATMKAG